jgi:hypothetical protein
MCLIHFPKCSTKERSNVDLTPSSSLINIQDFNSKAKEYQARQVLAAIDKMEKQK